MKDKRLYGVYNGMKQRCYNAENPSFKYYGARGIDMCDEWHYSFDIFKTWAYSHGYDKYAPKGQCTIERIDVNKGYSPDNCIWTDMSHQAKNKRKKIMHTENQTKWYTMNQLCDEIGITPQSVYRLFRLEKTLKTILDEGGRQVRAGGKHYYNEEVLAWLKTYYSINDNRINSCNHISIEKRVTNEDISTIELFDKIQAIQHSLDSIKEENVILSRNNKLLIDILTSQDKYFKDLVCLLQESTSRHRLKHLFTSKKPNDK